MERDKPNFKDLAALANSPDGQRLLQLAQQSGGGRLNSAVQQAQNGDYEAVKAISEAQVLIIGGTSLAVYPAAGLIDYFRGEHLVVINKSPTPRDSYADLLIQEPIGQVFSQIHC